MRDVECDCFRCKVMDIGLIAWLIFGGYGFIVFCFQAYRMISNG